MLELLELKVGCTSLLGTPPDEGRCPKFWPRDPVLRAEVDEVGNTISSLLGKPTEGCWEIVELEKVGCGSLLGTVPTEGCCANVSTEAVLLLEAEVKLDEVYAELEKVGCGSLLGTVPTEGCCADVSTEAVLLLEAEVKLDEVYAELEKVGCGSLLGTVPTEGCCADVSTEAVLLLEAEVKLDEVYTELEKVGCTGLDGIPLEGVSKMLPCSVLDSYSSLLVVNEVVVEEMGEDGWTISSLFGSPDDGCAVETGVVDSTVLLGDADAKTSSNALFPSSPVELDELVAVEVGGGEDVSVFVIVKVCVPVSPSRVGSIVVVYSDWPISDQGLSALKLERKGSQSK
jgi:phosphoribosyl-ATP pyrophosphohydrolase